MRRPKVDAYVHYVRPGDDRCLDAIVEQSRRRGIDLYVSDGNVSWRVANAQRSDAIKGGYWHWPEPPDTIELD